VQSFHSSDRISTGKFPEAASAKASETMKATFCFSNNMPSSIASVARTRTVRRDTLSSSLELTSPLRKVIA
jgi:hypothetical protein